MKSVLSRQEYKAAARSENDVQLAIVRFLRSSLPASHIVAHIPNKPRSKVAGAIEKSLGALAGIPDLVIIRPLGRLAFIEVKKEGGKLSPEQRSFRAHCQQWGIPHAVCRSIDDARNFIEEIGIETREAA